MHFPHSSTLQTQIKMTHHPHQLSSLLKFKNYKQPPYQLSSSPNLKNHIQTLLSSFSQETIQAYVLRFPSATQCRWYSSPLPSLSLSQFSVFLLPLFCGGGVRAGDLGRLDVNFYPYDFLPLKRKYKAIHCALSDPRGIESWATHFFFLGKSNIGAFPKAQS